MSTTSAQTLRKTGPGTLTITGSQTHFLNSAINNESGGGILNFNANGGTNLGINALCGTTNFGASQALRQSTVNNGATLNVGAAPQTASTASAVTLINGTISGSATVTGASYDVRNGSISTPLAGGGALTKTTASTVTLSGANSYTGGTTVSAGTLIAANGDAFAGGSVNVADAALGQAQAGLTKAVTVSTLNTNASGKFDLTNNSMVAKGMTDSAVRTQLQSGYNGGAWNGATGIVSSSVTSETSVGYATQAQTGVTDFKGVTGLAATDVLVKYTYAGDANLDGKVDIGDLGLLAGAWQQLSGKVWFDGDFTYDGAVDIGDLGLLAGNWQKGTAGNPNPPLMDFNTALAQFSAFEGVVVPEPMSLSLLALGGLALGRRRRHH
jgi:autotransporter-associated beta strand protein